MAHSFAIQAQLQVKGPPNLRPIISQIKAGLSNIKADIKINLSPTTLTSVNTLNARLTNLNKNLIAIQSSAKNANTVLEQLATTFNSMRGSAASVSTSLGKITSSVNQVGKATKTASVGVSQFGELLGVSAKKFAAFSLAAGSVAGFVFSIQNGFRDAIKFQHELVKLAQVGGDSAAVIKDITKEVTRLSTTLGVSSQGLIETAVTLRQAGLTATDTKKALEALAKTELAPTFDDIKKTTEGAIAVMAQFKISSRDLEGALGSINTVSAKYAVESADLIEAVRRSGGAFKAAGGNLNEFLALFTSVRATTRESAESIATGFRTIFARLQQPGTINALKQIGVSLNDLEGQFVGPYEAIRRLSEALKDIPTSDKRFAAVVEQIGGIRQVSKVIPLLKEFTITQQAYNDALAGQTSLSKDAITAQASLTVRITKLKEEFLDLFRVISEDSMIQAFIGSALSLASALIKITKALTPLIPLLTIFAAAKLGPGIVGFGKGISSGLKSPVKFARGGSVPGVGNGDTVPAMLTPGEFVIKKSAAQAIGHDTLKTWNKYADGGPVVKSKYDSAMLVPSTSARSYMSHPVVPRSSLKMISGDAEKVIQSLPAPYNEAQAVTSNVLVRKPVQGKVDKIKESIKKAIGDAISNVGSLITGGVINTKLNRTERNNIIGESVQQQGIGRIFEAGLKTITKGKRKSGSANFDFTASDMQKMGPFFGLTDSIPADAKVADHAANRASVVGKAIREAPGLENFEIVQRNINKIIDVKKRGKTVPTPLLQVLADNIRRAKKGGVRKATGGSINGTDTVPAMLTPGEFVINRESARAIGYANLHKANNVSKFANGGPVGFASGGTVPSSPAAPIDFSKMMVKNLDDFFKQAVKNGANKVDISRYADEIFSSLVDQVKRASPHLDDATAKKRAAGLYRPDTNILMDKRGKFFGSRDKEQAIATRFNDFLASPGPGAPFPLNKPQSKLDRFRGIGGIGRLGGKLSTGATVAGFALPGVAEQFLGNASQPGFAGRTGAGIGSVIGGTAAGATTGALIGSVIPGVGTALGGLVGGIVGATTSLVAFKKEISDIDSQKISDEFIKSLDSVGTNNKAGRAQFTTASKALISDLNGTQNRPLGFMENLKFNFQTAKNFLNRGQGTLGDLNASRLEAARTLGPEINATRQQEISERFAPALESALNQLKVLAEKNPTKDVQGLKNDPVNKDLFDSLKALAAINPKLVKETETQINNLIKQNAAQQALDLSLLKLSISAEELSTKISSSADIAEKNLARNAVGRGGKVSAGVDTFNIGALGARGKELNDFARKGGVLDQAKLAVTESLQGIKGGKLDKNSLQTQILSGLGNVKGFNADSDTGRLLVDSIANALNGDEGDKLINNAIGGDIQGLFSKVFENVSKLTPDIEKSNQELARAQQMFAQAALDIASQMDTIRSEQERIDQFRIGAERDRAGALMRNNTTSFLTRGGGVITPEDQMNEINTRAARESFNASQRRFGISAGDAANPEAIRAMLAEEQSNLSGLKSRAKAGATPESFSAQIVESTQKISYFQQALKNLSTSTVMLEAAQAKLNTALEKEAADIAGRKKVGEERAFGSRADIIKNMMADQLVGVAASQGHLENFSDQQRALTFSRLQDTSGVVRNIGGQQVTGQQIIDAIAAQYAPATNIASSMVNTPNGRRPISNEVLGAQANVGMIQNRMAAAGDTLVGVNEQEARQQAIENTAEFGTLIGNINKPLKDFYDTINRLSGGIGGKQGVVTKASGGPIKGTDTIPAMLSPGEFVVNAGSASKNMGLLHQINSSKTSYLADGGSPTGFTDEELAQRRIEKTRRERAHEIAKRVARREKLGLPEYVPMSRRVDNTPINAFNDPQAAQLRGEQLTRQSNVTRREQAAINIARQGSQRGAVAVANQGQGPILNAGGFNDAIKQFSDNSRPFIEALNSFPRELSIKRDGNINVVINGTEAMSKIKGDLEKYVYDKIIEAVQREVPKAVKQLPG